MIPEVCIVEDHRLLGQLVEIQLRAAGIGASVVALDPPLTEAILATGARLALLDVELGETLDTLAVCRRLVAAELIVVLFTGVADEAVLGRYLLAGAAGVIAKTDDLEGVVASIRSALDGRPIEPGEQRRNRMIDATRRHDQSVTITMEPFDHLTDSEAEVLDALVAGRSANDIASDRFVSITTVRAQIRSIHQKLGVSSQLGAVSLANRVGWSDRRSRRARET